MASVIVLLMVLFLSAATFAVVHALLGLREQRVADRLEWIGRRSEAQPEAGVMLASLPGWRTTLGRIAGRLLPRRLRSWFEGQLVVAGDPVSLESLMLAQIAGPLAVLIVLLPLLSAGLSPGLLVVVVALAAAAPVVWVTGRAARRQTSVALDLPDFVDLLVVSVEAGLGFEGALARISEYMRGALGDEIARVLGELKLGVGRRRALQGLAERTRVPAIASFASAVLQAEQTGMGVARVLRAQSEQLRAERRARAQEAALKAPLKMLFPLVFFIFPALFLVILGPAVLQLSQALRAGR